MKSLLIVLTLCICPSLISVAQHTQWTKYAYGGSTEGLEVVTDRSGNVFGIGTNYPDSPATQIDTVLLQFGTSNLFVVKYDSTGRFLWIWGAKNRGIELAGGTTDEEGNFYLLEYIPDTLNSSDMALYLVKLSPAGQTLYTKMLCDIGTVFYWYSAPNCIKERNGYLYMVTSFSTPSVTIDTTVLYNNDPSGMTGDLLYAKLDTGGNVAWAKSAGSQADDFNFSICLSPAGGMYLTGSYYSRPFIFDSITVPASDSVSFMIAKINEQGNVLWAKSGGSNGGMPTSITADGGNNVIVVGNFQDSLFQIGSYTFTDLSVQSDIFLSKYDPSGNLLWAKDILCSALLGNNTVVAATDSCNNIWITGQFSYYMVFGNDSVNADSVFGGYSYFEPMFLAGWNSAGTLISKTFFHSGGDDICDLKIENGNFYMCGDSVEHWETFFVSRLLMNRPDTSSVPASNLCLTTRLLLSAPAGYTYYEWTDGSSGATKNISVAGDYQVYCTNGCGSPIVADTFHVSFSPEDPAFSFGPDTFLCQPLMLRIPLIAGTFTWQDGSDKDSFYVTRSGTYYATVHIVGCSYSDTIQVTIPDMQQPFRDTAFCQDVPIDLTLTANVPPSATVVWSNGSTLPGIEITGTGRYWLTVSDSICTASDTITVSKQQCTCFAAMPGAFTPNNDGLNDRYSPIIEPGCLITNYHLSIFNRWGERVFYAESPSASWDGTFNGKPAEVGTFMYEVGYESGEYHVAHNEKGDLALIR